MSRLIKATPREVNRDLEHDPGRRTDTFKHVYHSGLDTEPGIFPRFGTRPVVFQGCLGKSGPGRRDLGHSQRDARGEPAVKSLSFGTRPFRDPQKMPSNVSVKATLNLNLEHSRSGICKCLAMASESTLN